MCGGGVTSGPGCHSNRNFLNVLKYDSSIVVMLEEIEDVIYMQGHILVVMSYE